MIESIESEFYPEIYNKSLPTVGKLRLCMVKNKGISRYCLAVVDFRENVNIEQQVRSARESIAKATKAFWLVREVGVYIVFNATKAPSDLKSADLPIDSTGLHAVIVQGVHIIGPNGYHLFNHSKWLNHTFGGANVISSKLQAITT